MTLSKDNCIPSHAATTSIAEHLVHITKVFQFSGTWQPIKIPETHLANQDTFVCPKGI